MEKAKGKMGSDLLTVSKSLEMLSQCSTYSSIQTTPIFCPVLKLLARDKAEVFVRMGGAPRMGTASLGMVTFPRLLHECLDNPLRHRVGFWGLFFVGSGLGLAGPCGSPSNLGNSDSRSGAGA